MKVIVNVFLILLFMVNSSLAETDLQSLWSQYAEIEFDSFFFADITQEDPLSRKGDILLQILETTPEDWLVNYELSSMEFDQSVYSSNRGATADMEFHQANSERYGKKAQELFAESSMDSIDALYHSRQTKGLAYIDYALLSDDPVIRKQANLLAYENLSGTTAGNIPLFRMMYELFGSEYLFKIIWRDASSQALYSDETALYVCEQVVENFGPLLQNDLQKYVKAQMYQMLVEANAFLAYSAYFCNDWVGMRDCVEKSAEILEERSKYGDVTGGIDPENNQVPICDMYDAHIRALYHAGTGDELNLMQDIEDYDLARQAGDKMHPIEFTPFVFAEMDKSIAALGG